MKRFHRKLEDRSFFPHHHRHRYHAASTKFVTLDCFWFSIFLQAIPAAQGYLLTYSSDSRTFFTVSKPTWVENANHFIIIVLNTLVMKRFTASASNYLGHWMADHNMAYYVISKNTLFTRISSVQNLNSRILSDTFKFLRENSAWRATSEGVETGSETCIRIDKKIGARAFFVTLVFFNCPSY